MDDLGKSQLKGMNGPDFHSVNKSTSLLERIIRNSCLLQSSTVQNSVDEEKHLLVGDKTCDSKNTQEIVDLIVNRKSCASDRSEILDYLIKKRPHDEAFMSGSLIRFCVYLLRMYCDPFSADTNELRMLIPLLTFLGNYNGRNSVLSSQSDFMYNLMRACVTCVTGFLSKSKELLKITRKKKLAGRVKSLGKGGSFKALSRALGVPDFITNDSPTFKEEALRIENFMLSLFDTTSDVIEKDINQHIASMQIPQFPDLNVNSEFSVDIFSELNSGTPKKEIIEEWTDVMIARVLPFGEIIAYTKTDWMHWLNLIDGELIEFLRICEDRKLDGDGVLQLEIGTPVGFWTTDARFPGWKPSISTRCLRGLIVGKAPYNFFGGEDISWAIWVVDIGSLVLCNKVYPLLSSIISFTPLASICSLDLGIRDPGKKESEFLVAALPLLTELLADKPSAARHMVAYESGNFEMEYDRFTDRDCLCEGGAFLMLIEYPDRAVRMEFLKLILSLTRNSTEVLRYFLECRFYIAVSSRLEICVHFCEAVSVDGSFLLEIRLLLLVLTAMVDECDKYGAELPGWCDIQKVLIMLTNIEEHPRVKFMAAKCLAILENHKGNQPVTNSFVNGNMGRTKVAESHCGAKAGSLVNKLKKVSQCINDKSKKDNGSSSTEVNMRNIILASTDGPEPVLSVMDVKDSDDDDNDYSNLPPVNALFDASTKADYYTKGYKVNFTNNETCELSYERAALQISESTLSKCVCGFLNNGVGGTIYFGINSKSIIEGIKLSRLERDTFRKGIDRMMSRGLYPEVRPSCYSINYVPVLNPGEKVKTLSAHKVWIIEVHVKALPHIVYTMASNRKCYVRQGTEFTEGMVITMRQDAAEQNKKEILKAIQEVKAQIPETKEKLALFVRDYLKSTQYSDCDF